MENNNILFIRADDNKIINEKCIVWVKKMDDCLRVCTKIDGCAIDGTHKICKLNNTDSYNKLNKYFESN
jgi:hypothetical protein